MRPTSPSSANAPRHRLAGAVRQQVAATVTESEDLLQRRRPHTSRLLTRDPGRLTSTCQSSVRPCSGRGLLSLRRTIRCRLAEPSATRGKQQRWPTRGPLSALPVPDQTQPPARQLSPTAHGPSRLTATTWAQLQRSVARRDRNPGGASETDALVQSVTELAGVAHTKRRQCARGTSGGRTLEAIVRERRGLTHFLLGAGPQRDDQAPQRDGIADGVSSATT